MGFARACFNPGFMMFRGGGFMMFLFWGVLIIAAIYLFKNLNKDKGYNEKNHYSDRRYESDKRNEQDLTSEEIARRRYAKGEIDKEEFEKIKKDLRR
ncbi:MAG: SHOCT domain-containing protein [Bacillota bacterium]